METKPIPARVPMMVAPTRRDGERALAHARRMFGRALASWACDALMIRRRGLDQIAWVPETVGRAA